MNKKRNNNANPTHGEKGRVLVGELQGGGKWAVGTGPEYKAGNEEAE